MTKRPEKSDRRTRQVRRLRSRCIACAPYPDQR